MAEYELGVKLREKYDNAPKGEVVTHIYLFGIEFADEIRNNHYRAKDIIKASGLPKSYELEIYNGVKLAKYVNLK